MKPTEREKRIDPVDKMVCDATAEEMVDWLVEYHGLPEGSRETAISNMRSTFHWHRLRGRLDRYPAWAALAELLLRRKAPNA